MKRYFTALVAAIASLSMVNALAYTRTCAFTDVGVYYGDESDVTPTFIHQTLTTAYEETFILQFGGYIKLTAWGVGETDPCTSVGRDWLNNYPPTPSGGTYDGYVALA